MVPGKSFLFGLLLAAGFIPRPSLARSKMQDAPGDGYPTSFKRLNCSSNSSRVSINGCSVKPSRGLFGIMSLSFLVLEEVEDIFIRIFIEGKSNSKNFAPTGIDSTFNLCEVHENQFVFGAFLKITDIFMPNSVEMVKTFVRPCPYVGEIGKLNHTVQKFTAPHFTPIGDLRVNVEFTDKEKRPLFDIRMVVFVRSTSWRQINNQALW